MPPLITYSPLSLCKISKKTLSVGPENTVKKVFRQIWNKNVLFWGQRVFSNYSPLPSLFTYSSTVVLWQIPENSFEWTPRTRYTKFWVKFRTKMSQFRAKKSFSKRNFIKKTLEWVPRTKYTRFRVPFGIKTFHFRAKKSFFHFFRSFFHHCLLILPYHFAKFLKKIFRVDSNKKVYQGLGISFFKIIIITIFVSLDQL